jgi:hypothetical protein
MTYSGGGWVQLGQVPKLHSGWVKAAATFALMELTEITFGVTPMIVQQVDIFNAFP